LDIRCNSTLILHDREPDREEENNH
jgi:hypothetical protein